MISRRTFLGAVSTSLLAAPASARAQPGRKVYRIEILSVGATTSDLVGPEPRHSTLGAFLRGLRELGYVYGEHFVTEPRGAESGPDRYPDLAAELVRLQVDVIVASGPALPALKQATSTVPIVMGGGEDPVAQGLAQSLGRPGGNFTGLSNQSVDTSAKRLELLKELVPRAELVAVLWDSTSSRVWRAADAAARERGWKLLSVEIRDAGELEAAFKTATTARAGALLVFAGGLLYPQTRRVAELAAKSRLPAIYAFRPQVEAGGLISYGADINDIWRRAAVFVDRILKGAKPADLPVEQPSTFELVINLKAAKSIGLTIPQSLLLRADTVIQ